MASQCLDCLLNRLFRRRSKKASKLHVTGLCEENSPVTGEFPSQRARNAENISISWYHHGTEEFHNRNCWAWSVYISGTPHVLCFKYICHICLSTHPKTAVYGTSLRRWKLADLLLKHVLFSSLLFKSYNEKPIEISCMHWGGHITYRCKIWSDPEKQKLLQIVKSTSFIKRFVNSPFVFSVLFTDHDDRVAAWLTAHYPVGESN